MYIVDSRMVPLMLGVKCQTYRSTEIYRTDYMSLKSCQLINVYLRVVKVNAA